MRIEGHLQTGRTVIIYTDKLLGWSSTFIRDQAESLQRFVPYYFGCRRISGISLPLPEERTRVIYSGGIFDRAREVAFKLGMVSPGIIAGLRSLSPALIHAHHAADGLRALPVAQKLNIPLITTCHGADVLCATGNLKGTHLAFRQYVRRRSSFQKSGTTFIAVSKILHRAMLEQGYPAERCVLHYIGIDTEFFKAGHTGKRERVVLFVGRLVEKKGCEYLLRAMEAVRRTTPDLRAVVIGDGPLRSGLEAQAASADVGAEFLGRQTPAAVRDWMERAMLFCVPSVVAGNGDAESFGMVFAEAQAMGLPVVSFATGGIPEAVAHGKTGWLARERDWEQLAHYLSILISDEGMYRAFSEAGPKYIAENFDLRRQTARLEDLYDDVACRYGHGKVAGQN